MSKFDNSYGIFKVFKAKTYEQAQLKAIKHCNKIQSKFIRLWQDNDW